MNQTLTWSYGGGTQSIAIAVLVAQRKLPVPKHIIIADTGREATETWEYTDRYIKQLLATVGAEIELAPHSLSTVDLLSKSGKLLIPAWTEKGQNPGFCSNEWKQRVVRRYLQAKGYGKKQPIIMWLGISTDEIGRLKPSGVDWIEHQWPLCFDVHMRRSDCRQLILDYGLPEPPKSSCWMCPYRNNKQWLHLKEHYPDDFAKAIELDDSIRAVDPNYILYVHKNRVPLKDADLTASENDSPQMSLFGEVEHCDSGFCWS